MISSVPERTTCRSAWSPDDTCRSSTATGRTCPSAPPKTPRGAATGAGLAYSTGMSCSIASRPVALCAAIPRRSLRQRTSTGKGQWTREILRQARGDSHSMPCALLAPSKSPCRIRQTLGQVCSRRTSRRLDTRGFARLARVIVHVEASTKVTGKVVNQARGPRAEPNDMQ